jgi:hypothetical protein
MHVLTLTALEERLSQVQAHLQRAADAAHDQRSLFELVHATATMAATRALVRLAVNEPTSEAAALVLGYEALPEIGLRLARAGMGVALDPLPPIATETKKKKDKIINQKEKYVETKMKLKLYRKKKKKRIDYIERNEENS